MVDERSELLAEPESLLGQLQRGRGAGFLAALAADAKVVRSLLLTCILHDPRFDAQLEHRADYYARLALHVHLPLAPLEESLKSRTDALPYNYERLPLPVLARMAVRGHGEAAAILVRYLSYGVEWTGAFEAIVVGGHADQWPPDLGRIILERFPDEGVLAEEIETKAESLYRAGIDFPDDAVLGGEIEQSALATAWDKWAAVEPRIATIIGVLRQPTLRPSEQSIRASIDPAWSVSTLLSHATHDSARIFGEVAAQRAGASDLPALLDAVFGDDTVQLEMASRALAVLGREEALPRLLRFVEEFDEHADARLAQYRMNAIRRILAATPEGLPIARVWLRADGWARPSVALSILKEQSEEADVPVLRGLISSAIDREPGDVAVAYYVEGCLDALTPFPAQISFEELARVFDRTWSKWNRRAAAELMAEGHLATFSGTHAIECLWDCEDEIVEIGCAYAELPNATVRDRLDHFWHSPYEEAGVRRKAEKRLRACAP